MLSVARLNAPSLAKYVLFSAEDSWSQLITQLDTLPETGLKSVHCHLQQHGNGGKCWNASNIFSITLCHQGWMVNKGITANLAEDGNMILHSRKTLDSRISGSNVSGADIPCFASISGMYIRNPLPAKLLNV